QLVLEGHQLRLADHPQPISIDLEQPFDVELSRSTTHAGDWVHLDIRPLGAPPSDAATPSTTPQRLRLSVPSQPPEAMPELEVPGLVIAPDAVTGWLWPALVYFAQAHGRSLEWSPAPPFSPPP
ncbi:MAG: hypothetical protein AAFX99_36120, partial [Myxococcota bacterium]